ncbi:MAG: exodeoxyribonuclease VII small subunit [Holosporaceae bacterium]|nr:exodeoxyribonuclease VII small subunit [Holosporaceae bacterium]
MVSSIAQLSREHKMTSSADIAQMEFEEALRELEQIVKTLEEGKSPLKVAVDLYERGVLLKKHCDGILESLQLRVNQISSDKNGGVRLEQLEVES